MKDLKHWIIASFTVHFLAYGITFWICGAAEVILVGLVSLSAAWVSVGIYLLLKLTSNERPFTNQ